MDRWVEFQLTPAACILGAVALLILPLRWIAGFMLAASVHELFHNSVLCFYHIPVYRFSVGIGGAQLETGPMTRRQEFLCALAGPVGSFLVVLMYRLLPVAAVCAFIQGLFNLIPVFPSDGGRILRCIAGERISEMIGKGITILLLGLGIYGFARMKLGFGVLIPVALIVAKMAFRKIPCKDGPLRVQ